MEGTVVWLIVLGVAAIVATVAHAFASPNEPNILLWGLVFCLALLAFEVASTIYEVQTGGKVPDPEPPFPMPCENGLLPRIDGTCPCSEFDLRARC